MEETKKEYVIRVEAPRSMKTGAEAASAESKVSGLERKIKIEIPAGIELSEEEMRKIASAAENEIVDVIRGAQAKLMAKQKVVEQHSITILNVSE